MSIVLLHAGTHKTGSTALQLLLANNREALGRAGVYVPATGVAPGANVGHHALAGALYRSDAGTLLQELLAELRRADAPLAVLSSEEFSPLAHVNPGITPLLDALRSAGHDVRVLVYLRAQHDWAESLYGEHVRGRPAPLAFGPFMEAAMRLGGFSDGTTLHMPFDYAALVQPFTNAFGRDALIARNYPGRSAPQVIYQDFLRVLGALHPPFADAPLDIEIAQATANESFAFIGLIAALHDRLHGSACGHDPLRDLAEIAPDLDRATFVSRFRLLTHDDALALLERFGPANERFASLFGLRVPMIARTDIPVPEDPRWTSASRQRAIVDAVVERWSRSPRENNDFTPLGLT
jgi:hypothetical protein